MSSINFEDFEVLWKRVESKFVDENKSTFTLDNLRSLLISQNLANSLTNFKSIEEKFLKFSGLPEKPQNVNLPDTIFNALYNYVGIKGIFELRGHKYFNPDDVIEKIKEESGRKKEQTAFRIKNNLSEIGFLGREQELSELENFLQSSEEKIFALYGVPMIGKTKLVSHFLENNETAKTYNTIPIGLNPNPENSEQRIKEEIFGDKDFNDFSAFSANTLIVIRNFEEILKWTGNPKDLHDIKNEYPNIKIFLEKASQISTIKLILESRFQIHFEVFFADWRTKIKILPSVQLEGIERDKFWQFYKSRGFTYEQFEKLCENFNNHTGLLALAYNDVEFLYQNRLIEAFYEPTIVTRLLWDLVERIIDRLVNREIWILCALTFLQKPVKKEDVFEDFLTLPDFEDELQIGDSFNSLTNKLLIQLERGFYDLNPYIREVCYTFLRARRRVQMQIIQNLPYFKEHGKTPYYDKIRQAHERGDFLFLLRLGQRLRHERKYSESVKILELSLDINPKKEVVLNEIAITYRQQKNWKKAIEILETANKKYPDDVKTLNELGICYRENRQLDKAIEILETANKKYPDDFKTLNELGICYRENRQLDKAIEILETAVNLGHLYSYNELGICYRENRQLDKAIEILETANKKYPDNVRILNELAICYGDSGNYDESIKTAKKSIKLLHCESYTVLATTYQKMGNIETAYKVAEEGMKTSGWDKSRLTKKFHELKELLKQNDMKKLKVFLSYSHKDEDIKEELDNHLSALKRSDKISTWNDRELPAGAKWDSVIKAELEEADIVLLLISANFIASNYIWNIEIKKAIEKHENGTAVVIPIFCKSCDFDDMPFAKLQGLPNDAKFISSQTNKDQAYTEVAKGIRKVVESRLS